MKQQRFTLSGPAWRPGRSFRPARQRPRRSRWPVMVTAAAAVAAMGVAACAGGGGSPPAAAGGGGSPATGEAPPRLEACLAGSRLPCDSQDPLHRVYDLGQLYARGITGAGTTVAIIDDGANPWARTDLAAFDRYFRLPPAQLRVLPWGQGAPGRIDLAAAREDIGDLELIHFIAPGARLLYVQVPPGPGLAPVAEAMAALGAVAARQHISAASLSWGIPETAIARGKLAALRAGLVRAARYHVSVIAATGDSGPTWPGLGRRVVAWPASDPLVTAVGGDVVQAGPSGQRLRPDTVAGGLNATGAGRSALFPRPAYQDQVSGVVGDHRGMADVSMDCAMWVYALIPHDPQAPGWFSVCGSSPAAPMFAGIAALADQAAGHPLGLLNPLLYRLHGTRDGVLDITQGNNTDDGVRGYPAGPGYDLPSGIGTVGSAPAFVTALAHRRGQPARVDTRSSL
jgi:subtilase family serine protease